MDFDSIPFFKQATVRLFLPALQRSRSRSDRVQGLRGILTIPTHFFLYYFSFQHTLFLFTTITDRPQPLVLEFDRWEFDRGLENAVELPPLLPRRPKLSRWVLVEQIVGPPERQPTKRSLIGCRDLDKYV